MIACAFRLILHFLGFPVNLFRARTTDHATEEMRATLLSYGATWALTEAELTDKEHPLAKEIRKAGPIKLALNCLGGKPAVTQLKFLGESGTLVSYGAMTRSPIPLPAGPLIFRDIRLRGFWMSAWIQRESKDKRQTMLNLIAEWLARGLIQPSPSVCFPLDDWRKALSMSTFSDQLPNAIKKKAILTMD
ncbi:Trans-2-enoyl-CoA reductase mitochondrial [Fasciola hepatica]|uniref:Trans-2-enoyl-CoA reductase mitochondrial n=1 Tax=Fasciola hepatica TaxID=6192 RepID=A0A4E0RNK4_FASHE|nr:Trans-2-enoyl-CoA reductase mitochondrial [Fasciola hepatica]